MRALNSNPNVDNSDLVNYPDGRIKNNTGGSNGTPVNERVKGDTHQFFQKLMRLYGIVPNGLPDNEGNGFQLIDALRGIASKNDFIYPLSTNGTILNVDIKFSLMLENEYILCRAAFDKSTETEIKGIGVGNFAITYSGSFKTNEYVRIIKTAVGVSIIRVSDWLSLDAMATELLFLKKASQVEEDAGAIDTVSTTPLSNLVAFTKRVIGIDSGNYLATAIRDGLYPKAHYAIVDALGAPIEKNYGTFTGSDFDDDAVNTTYAVSGTITEAKKVIGTANGGVVELTFSNSHVDVNKIQAILSIKYIGDHETANDQLPLVWTPTAVNKIRVYIEYTSFGARTIEIQVQTNER